MDQTDVQAIVQQAIDEYMRQDTARREPAFKTELKEERRRREHLEKRLNETAEENKKARAVAEEAQRAGAIRSELQRLGVAKVDLAFKIVQDQIARNEDGRLTAGSQPMSEYLTEFLNENPEFLAARAIPVTGGTGLPGMQKIAPGNVRDIDLNSIGPSMGRDELERVREEIMRIGLEMNRSAGQKS